MSQITLLRIQALESLTFEWEHVQATAQTREDFSTREIRGNHINVTFEPEESDWNGEVHLAYISGRTEGN
jgi:hypothetical protein